MLRTCCRCGRDFRRDGGRLCAVCREAGSPAAHEHSYRRITLRETQIVRLVGLAKSNKDIAGELRLTEGTIKEHLNRIFRKLEVKNRTELAIWVHKNLPPGVYSLD